MVSWLAVSASSVRGPLIVCNLWILFAFRKAVHLAASRDGTLLAFLMSYSVGRLKRTRWRTALDLTVWWSESMDCRWHLEDTPIHCCWFWVCVEELYKHSLRNKIVSCWKSQAADGVIGSIPRARVALMRRCRWGRICPTLIVWWHEVDGKLLHITSFGGGVRWLTVVPEYEIKDIKLPDQLKGSRRGRMEAMVSFWVMLGSEGCSRTSIKRPGWSRAQVMEVAQDCSMESSHGYRSHEFVD